MSSSNAREPPTMKLGKRGIERAWTSDEIEDSLNPEDEIEKWNYPRSNITRLVFAFLSFFLAGMNDGAVGALIPYLEEYYKLSYTVVSLIFLTPFVGYSLAAFTNAYIHVRLGQRGIAFIAPSCYLVTYIVLSLHPPWPVLVVMNISSGFGTGLVDACFSAWIGAMDRANVIQGLLHACYPVGALCAPLVATNLILKAGVRWYFFYYIMIGLSALELVGLTLAFWEKTGKVYRAQHPKENNAKGAGTRESLKLRTTWLCAAFFFVYMGVEVGLGGWVVTFMLRVRKASAYGSGVSVSGFWAGMVVGRAGLGFVTERYGERLCVTIYLLASVALHLLFWLVPQFLVSAITVSFLGMFLGPLFPGAVILVAKLLPKRIHVSAIGFAMAIGGTGGTVFPFIIGAIASSKGVAVLQPVVLALIASCVVVWFCFPRLQKVD